MPCHVGEEVFVSPVLSVLLVQESFCWRLLLLSGTIPDLAAKIQISNTQSPGIDVVVQCSLAYRKLCSMLRIDVSQGCPFLMSGVTRASRAAIASFLHLWLVSGLCVPALCHSICLLCGVVYSVGLAFSASAANIADVGRFLQLLARIVIVCPYILSGSPLLCRCSTFGGNFPSRTNRLVCILWRFGSVFLMDVHRESLWRSFAILPTHIVGFCGFARLFHSGFFSHISLLRFLFDPTMSASPDRSVPARDCQHTESKSNMESGKRGKHESSSKLCSESRSGDQMPNLSKRTASQCRRTYRPA